MADFSGPAFRPFAKMHFYPSNLFYKLQHKKIPCVKTAGEILFLSVWLSLPFWRQQRPERQPIWPTAHDMASKTRRSSIDSNT